MREGAILLAALYILGYVLWRRRPARVVVLCPLRSGRVPQEIVERLGSPREAADVESLARGEIVLGYLVPPPGIALAEVTDEASLDARLGRYLEIPGGDVGRRYWLKYLGVRPWDGLSLLRLALSILHGIRPRSLVVDFRPPPPEVARDRRISRTARDVDCGMYAYEILCRMGRTSAYREASFVLAFCGKKKTWLYEEKPERFREPSELS